MSWLRLYITVEGQAEKAFADQALTPHLANYNIEVKPRVVLTNRKLGKRGGILDFAKIEGDLTRLMHQDRHPEARFTTMIDFYALPPEFPGWAEARKKALPKDRVAVLEDSLHSRFGDNRFHPYIQLQQLSDEVGPDRSLLVVCSAFRGRKEGYSNLTVKKIPKAVLTRCEWGKDDYSLKVENLSKAPPQMGQQELF